ncbi:hypothetical protein Kpol_1053p32, partial [Vanderwaltozyma polyspora DSM 70294]
MQLTKSQETVVEFPYEPESTLKIIAGPGSGKTITLLHRVKKLIDSGIAKPDEILILSLTNKAVDNILDKLLDLFEQKNGNPSIEFAEENDPITRIVSQIGVYTIHGLANRIVIENEGLLEIIEENGWKVLMKLVSSEFWKNSKPTAREFERLYNQYKNSPNGKDVVEKISKLMIVSKVVTNNELIIRASEHLLSLDSFDDSKKGIEFTSTIKNDVKIVMIDEFQDLYPTLLPLLTSISKGKRLEIYGDTNQSIYQFLGNNKEVIKAIDEIHPQDKLVTLKLDDNFRSTPEITNLANTIVNKYGTDSNYLKTGYSKSPSGVQPLVIQTQNSIEELDYIIERIVELSCSSVKLSDIAILARTNAKLDMINNFISDYGIPTQKLSAYPEWVENPSIRFLIDILKIISVTSKQNNGEISYTNRTSDFNILSLLSDINGIGQDSLQKLHSECLLRNISLWKQITSVSSSNWSVNPSSKKRISEVAKILLPQVESCTLSTIEEPLAFLETLCALANQLNSKQLIFNSEREMIKFQNNLEEFLKVLKLCKFNLPEGVTLLDWFLETYLDQSLVLHNRSSHMDDKEQGKINLSTIHSSKGLEFPDVMLIGDLQNKFQLNIMF